MYNELFALAVKVNEKKDTNVYLCLHGNTNCINLTIEKSGQVPKTIREFVGNKELQKMIEVLKQELSDGTVL